MSFLAKPFRLIKKIALSFADDDYIAIDGATQKTRKMSAITLLTITSANIAPEYTQTTYDEGEIRLHEGLLYKCSVQGGIQSAEPWTAAHWTRTTLVEWIQERFGNGLLMVNELPQNPDEDTWYATPEN